MSSVKEEKLAEKAAYVGMVRSTLDDAKAAAEEAFKNFARTAKRTTDGHIADSCGGAYVVVYKPSYRLRTALQEMNEIAKGFNGAWSVSHFTKSVNEQSITASEVACQAALGIIRERLPNEGEFYMKSYID